jgi:hypothetical protein
MSSVSSAKVIIPLFYLKNVFFSIDMAQIFLI